MMDTSVFKTGAYGQSGKKHISPHDNQE